LVGAVFMLEAIAFVAIITAAITSSFVDRAQRERTAESDASSDVETEQLMAQLSEISARLARIEQSLRLGGSASASVGDG
jgi:voltage-gated potassium channel